MSELPTPHAKRLQRPSWRDSRLVVGVVLVLVATVLAAKLISSADDSVPMFAASTALKPGDRLSDANLVRVDVQLSSLQPSYLSASRGVPADRYVTRAVPAGELVPLDALGGQDAVDVRPVTVKVDSGTASALRAGGVVDVWVSLRDPSTTQERYLAAQKALTGVSIAGTPQTGGAFTSADAQSPVQLLVSGDKVGTVISDIDKGARFTLVPVPGYSGTS